MATSGPPQVPIRFAQSGKLPRSWQWQSVDLDVVHVVSKGVVFRGSWRISDPFQVIIVECSNMNEPLMNYYSIRSPLGFESSNENDKKLL